MKKKKLPASQFLRTSLKMHSGRAYPLPVVPKKSIERISVMLTDTTGKKKTKQ